MISQGILNPEFSVSRPRRTYLVTPNFHKRVPAEQIELTASANLPGALHDHPAGTMCARTGVAVCVPGQNARQSEQLSPSGCEATRFPRSEPGGIVRPQNLDSETRHILKVTEQALVLGRR